MYCTVVERPKSYKLMGQAASVFSMLTSQNIMQAMANF